jgi:hypothetical protein
MYQKVLVPLEDSEDSRSIVNALSGLVAEDAEAILFHVIPPRENQRRRRIRYSGHTD